VRALSLLVIWMICILGSYASTPPQPQPAATLDLFTLLPPGRGELGWTTIAFVSETSIAIGLCRQSAGDKCSHSLVRWEGGVLRLFAQTPKFSGWVSVHPASDGRILTTWIRSPQVLYSHDLSTSFHLPSFIDVSSQTGRTVATISKGGWKIYHLSTTIEPIREGTGSLRSISDEVVVFGNIMRTETLEGKLLGSFSVKPEEKCYNNTQPLGDNKLYLSDCKSERIVDFNGTEQLKLRPPKGCCDYDNSWSANGSRLLFDYTRRDVSVFRNVGEIALALGTLGAGVGELWNNRQEVRVVDTVTGASCLDWRRSFPMEASFIFKMLHPFHRRVSSWLSQREKRSPSTIFPRSVKLGSSHRSA
jgi:hypothetical protein